MSGNPTENDEADDLDRELPDESDMDDSADENCIECAHCGKMIHEQSEWCHHCGKYVSKEDAPPSTSPVLIVGTLLGLLAVLGGAIVWLLL